MSVPLAAHVEFARPPDHRRLMEAAPAGRVQAHAGVQWPLTRPG
ncbi:hypothetical protein SAMN06893097_106297 [Geodermatophilus sabuli]|uniref:Uncharacterized protein n=1 Tax=Geodermatophilus sabuli TaxID=1564158 RepID=A0A285EEE3_9ACTN|nr:hypothetical protein SAMN06893097_106297 [Geodermatophilus sabuli]